MKGLSNYTLTLILTVNQFLLGCAGPDKDDTVLFRLIPPEQTQIDFINKLHFDQDFNIYTYRNFYNGGGVALGDINNDGLIDIYFTANQGSNRLYLNKGNFQFEDITVNAGVGGERGWSTGVCMVDINGDGWLDIYVCNSGDIQGDNKENELFINNGDLTFTERGREYGVDDHGFTTHAAFFDYDNDGDLDLYILNNSYLSIESFNLMKVERPNRDKLGGDKLLRNDNGRFVDVTDEAGIFGSVIGFGLGVTVGDINKDGWLDIYVSNDFFERDYLYINQKDGTFEERLTKSVRSISASSMGADLADINNDTWPDIFVTDMLPETNDRIKSVTTFQNWDNYQYNLENGYYHQFTRNSFQLNKCDTTFTEIGRLMGVEATDWSWGALMFDMNNDGLRDIFVANGIYKDLTDQDYLQHITNTEVIKSAFAKGFIDYSQMIDAIPSNPVPNYAFQNRGNHNFVNRAKEWGLGEPSFSNGSAYGDLDNDGDLDIVVNNVNMPPFIYQNRSERDSSNHYLKIVLKGEGLNTAAIGAKITLIAGAVKFYTEQMPMRGFQSSVDPRPNVGLGEVEVLDTVLVQWPSGKVSLLENVKADQTLHLNESDAIEKKFDYGIVDIVTRPLLKDITQVVGISHLHQENDFVDFDRDHLAFHMLSTQGPGICVGDVNGDGRDDFFIGGAKGHSGALYRQQSNGKFIATNEMVFDQDKIAEDLDCIFFDADNDGDLDLYVASGGSEFGANNPALADRLYINDGRGVFTRSLTALPQQAFHSTSCVKAADYDGDGSLDLFVGTRQKPGQYGMPVSGYILRNDGDGHFSDVTTEVAPDLIDIGMITDAVWQDIDKDGDPDLVITGDWMPITILLNDGGRFINITEKSGLGKSNGWWNRIVTADIDHDGDIDFVVGNHGLNSRFKASADKPLTMYTGDFDENGDVEQIICMYNGDVSYPIVLRHDLVAQLQGLKKKYLRYDQYKNETIDRIFTQQELNKAVKSEVYELRSSLLINDGSGKFSLQPLPIEVQFSPVYGILIHDLDGDGNNDIFHGGNLYGAKPEVGRYDACSGHILRGNGKGEFFSLPKNQSGVHISGEIRDIKSIRIMESTRFLISRSNGALQVYGN